MRKSNIKIHWSDDMLKVRPKLRVLIVDDFELNREMLGSMLGDEYEILEAENGVQAVEIMREHVSNLSLILLDVQMPQMDGLEIDPCIPGDWDGFKAHRVFRGASFEITVENPEHVEKGVKEIWLDGEKTDRIPICEAGSSHTVRVVMG